MSPLSFEEFIASPELTDLVQKRVDHYRRKWEKMYARVGSLEKMRWWILSVNWAAFLIAGGAWFFYRKMYRFGAIWASAVIGLIAIDTFIISIPNAIFIGVNNLVGMYGNALYFRHTYDLVVKARASGQTCNLKAQSGVSWVWGIVGFVATLWIGGVIVELPEIIQSLKNPNSVEETAGSASSTATSNVAAPQAQPTATAFDPSGKYDYREKGYSGGIELIAKGDGTYAISIGTAQDQSLGICSIGEVEGMPILAKAERLADKAGAIFKIRPDEEQSCAFELEVEPGSASVSTGETNCSYFCGAGGVFTGVYIKSPN